MPEYSNERLRYLKVGISSYTDNELVLDVIGNVNVSQDISVGDVKILSSGIITSSNPGISTLVYYGDGSNLFGVNAFSADYASTAGISTYANLSGIATYSETSGISTYASFAGVTTALQNSRTFEITGDIVAPAVSFDGTGNVSFAATIQPNSVGLGTDTTGDYVQSISGAANQITVISGTGESSTPIISISPNPLLPGNVTIANDLQVNNNLNVTGNITIGGTSAYIISNDFRVKDADIITGFTTDSNGNDASNDTTANHGGIAVASTEGHPLVQLYNVAIGETNPATYKKIMWFKSGSFAGLNTDAWLINYAVGIGSTQFPSGTRLAAGSVQFTENDLVVVRNINASGIITASSFSGNASSATYASAAGIATYSPTSGIATYASTSGIATYATSAGISTVAQGLTGTPNINVGVVTATTYNGSGINLTGIVTTITAGSNISINQSTGNVTISATGGSGNLGIATAGGTVGTGVTLIDLRGAGISTVTVSSGIATINIPSSTRSLSTYTATEGQTSFSASYKVGYVDVFLNGVKLSQTEYIATDESTINLSKGASLDDIIEIIGYNVNIVGEPTNKIGVSTEGGIVSNDVILLDFRGSGISGVSVSSGIATVNLESSKWLPGTGNNIYRLSGNVGVGLTNPQYTLDVNGDINFSGNFRQNGSLFSGSRWTAGIGNTIYRTSGNVGIATTNPQYTLDVNGDINFSGNFTQNGTIFSGSRWTTGIGNTIYRTSGNVGIATTNPQQTLEVNGSLSSSDLRVNSVSEKSTIVSGNTVSLVYNTGGGNIAICTNPTGPITLNVTGIPTDNTFDNRTLTFTVVAIQTSVGYACSTINLNGVSRTVRYPGGIISVGSTNSYDIFNFTGINTVGSANTTSNYQILGLVNGNFK